MKQQLRPRPAIRDKTGLNFLATAEEASDKLEPKLGHGETHHKGTSASASFFFLKSRNVPTASPLCVCGSETTVKGRNGQWTFGRFKSWFTCQTDEGEPKILKKINTQGGAVTTSQPALCATLSFHHPPVMGRQGRIPN